jgi:hypothetical protein
MLRQAQHDKVTLLPLGRRMEEGGIRNRFFATLRMTTKWNRFFAPLRMTKSVHKINRGIKGVYISLRQNNNRQWK